MVRQRQKSLINDGFQNLLRGRGKFRKGPLPVQGFGKPKRVAVREGDECQSQLQGRPRPQRAVGQSERLYLRENASQRS